MSKFNFLLVIGLIESISLFEFQAKTKEKLPYKNAELTTEQRVEDLLSRMTLEGKVYQLCALRLGEGDEIFKTSGHDRADLDLKGV